MFKRKSVNWRKLSHAYGSARDVPQLLKALTSEEATTRSQALDKLNASLCHQGTVYSATVASVPIFVELLQIPNIHDKSEILILLGCFARGFDEDEFEEFLPTGQKTAYSSVFPALLDGLSLYLQLLNDPDSKIRAASSYLLTCFAEAEPTIVEEIFRALFVESDPLAQASFILNLPKGAAQRPDIHALLLETVKQEQKPIVQLAAAMELAIDLQQDMPLEAVVVLLDVLMKPKPLAATYNELTANLNDVVSDVADCLCLAGRKYRQQSLPILIQALDKNRAFTALKIAHALLSLTFDPNNSLLKGERTKEQETALQAIAGSQRAWRYNLNMAEILRSFLACLTIRPVALQAY